MRVLVRVYVVKAKAGRLRPIKYAERKYRRFFTSEDDFFMAEITVNQW
jgi:hypothetical protein